MDPPVAVAISCGNSLKPMSTFVHDPALLQKYLEMAQGRFPGPDYYEVLRCIHHTLRPRTYVEIGIREGASLACALPETRCLGIDPDPNIAFPLPPDTTIYRTTSDEFFASRIAEDALSHGFDLAFIDGFHIFEQALRDFIEVEKRAHAGSVILIHDCIPLDQTSSARIRTTDFYCGDVWKLSLCLGKYRPALEQAIVPTGPSGLCIVSAVDPGSTILSELYDNLVEEFVPLDYSAYCSAGTHPFEIPNQREHIVAYVERLRRQGF
jgi:hypothetical protein